MNKYLLMSAAAALASTASTVAHAATYMFHLITNNGGSYCDGGTLYTNGVVYAWTHNFTHACGFSHNTFGQGLLGKVKGLGKVAAMSDTYNELPYVLEYVLPKNAKVGGTWYLYITTNGVTSMEVNSGTIGPGLAARRPGAKSTLKAVKDILAKLNTKN